MPVASLCLYGSTLDPAAISQELQCKPSSAQTKGQSFVSSSGKRRTSETGLWMVSSEQFCTSADVRDHIDCLLQALKLNSDLRAIRGVEHAVLSLCIISSEQPTLLNLPPEILEQLAKLGLTLEIDAY